MSGKNVNATVSRGEKRKRSESYNEEEQEVKLGFVLEPLTIAVLEKDEKTIKNSTDKYYYFLVKEKGRKKLVEAWSFYEDTAYIIYETLEVGYTYQIAGDIRREPEKTEYLDMRKSEYKWKYFFNNIDVKKLDEIPHESFNPGSAYYKDEATQISDLKTFIQDEYYFQYRFVQCVQLISGNIYRYVGCRKCQTSQPKNIGQGSYRCRSSKCRYEAPAGESLETFIMICNLKIKDVDGNELENIVCFNDATEELLKKKSSQYKCDEDAEDDFRKILNSIINLRLSFQRRPEPFNDSVVAIYIAIPDSIVNRLEADARALPATNAYLEISDNVNIVIKDANSYRGMLDQDTEYELKPGGPSGYLLLLNVFKYERAGADRNGANMDFLKLFGLFSSLDFKIYGNDHRKPLHLSEISERIKQFKLDLIENKIGSFAIIVLGHGCNYNVLELSNKQLINIDKEIMEPFSSANFPEFIDKPKIFMFNLCRAHAKLDKKQSVFDNTGIVYPDIQNAYLSYSTLPGHFSIRNPSNGSFFVDRFFTTVMEYVTMPAMDLKNLFTAVEFSMNKDRKMICPVGQDPYLALPCEHKSLVFRKFRFKVLNGEYDSDLKDLYDEEYHEYLRRKMQMIRITP